MKITYKCPICGGTNVQGKAWVYLNDLCKDIQAGVIDSTDEEDYYCVDCGEHIIPEIESDSEELNKLLKGEM